MQNPCLRSVAGRQADTCVKGVAGSVGKVDTDEDALDGWKNEVVDAANQIAGGDVRINLRQPDRDASTLNLLSRSSELKREL